ncbi:MAG: hypothetical protein JNL96_21830 [Planctomycetaceae bacterium]|nr:hypothetical protein [Planctomycetaceae bacterium]
MTLMQFIVWLCIAGICGAIGQAIAGFSRGGCLVAIAVGFIGALIGPRIAAALGLGEIFVVQIGGEAFPVIWSIIGATIFVAVIGLLSPRRPLD